MVEHIHQYSAIRDQRFSLANVLLGIIRTDRSVDDRAIGDGRPRTYSREESGPVLYERCLRMRFTLRLPRSTAMMRIGLTSG